MAFDATSRRLAIVGADPDVELWDLAALSDGLTGVGLSWDRPTPATAPEDGPPEDRASPTPEVVVLRPGNLDPAEYRRADERLSPGSRRFQQGRFADAVVDLQQASERFQALRRSSPGDPDLASQHGTSLGYLGRALRDSNRRVEALCRAREALAVYESLKDPTPNELYPMACICTEVSALLDHGSPAARENSRLRRWDSSEGRLKTTRVVSSRAGRRPRPRPAPEPLRLSRPDGRRGFPAAIRSRPRQGRAGEVGTGCGVRERRSGFLVCALAAFVAGKETSEVPSLYHGYRASRLARVLGKGVKPELTLARRTSEGIGAASSGRHGPRPPCWRVLKLPWARIADSRGLGSCRGGKIRRGACRHSRLRPQPPRALPSESGVAGVAARRAKPPGVPPPGPSCDEKRDFKTGESG